MPSWLNLNTMVINQANA